MSNDDRYSPSLKGDLKAWEQIVDIARQFGETETLNRLQKTFTGSKQEYNFKEDGLDYIISSEGERVKTKEQMIEETNVNEDEYDIYWYSTNKWDQHSVDRGLVELYQVKLKMKRLEDFLKEKFLFQIII